MIRYACLCLANASRHWKRFYWVMVWFPWQQQLIQIMTLT